MNLPNACEIRSQWNQPVNVSNLTVETDNSKPDSMYSIDRQSD